MDAGFNLMCCKKCRGLFIFQDMFLNHAKECEGDPNKSPSQFFACEREIFLQSYERLTPKFFGKLECSSVFHTTGHFLSPADSSQQLDQSSTISENTSQSDTSELQTHGPDSHPDSADEYRYYKNESEEVPEKRSPKKGMPIKTEIKQEMADYVNADYRVVLAQPLKAEDDFPVQNHKKKEKPVPVKLIPNIVTNNTSDWTDVTKGNENNSADIGKGDGIGKLFSVLKKTGKPIFECNECKYKTRKVTLMKKHQKDHASGNPLKCEKCSFTTFVKANFGKHVKTHAPCEVSCNVCGSMQPDKYTLDRHKKLEHEEKKAEKKGKKKENKLGIMYAQIVNEDASVVYNCRLCDYTSIENADMEKHVVVHSSVKVSIAQMDDSSHQGSSASQNSDISDDSEDGDDGEDAESMETDHHDDGQTTVTDDNTLLSAISTLKEKDESETLNLDLNCKNAEERKAVQDLYEQGKGDPENQSKSDVGFVIEKVESLSKGQEADVRSLSLELDSSLWDRMDTTDKDSALPDLDPVGSFLNDGFEDNSRTDFSTLGFEDTLKQLQMAVNQPAEIANATVPTENTTMNSEASLKIASIFSGGISFPLESMSRKEDDAKSNSSSETITYEVRLNAEMEEQSQAPLVTSSSSPPRAGNLVVTGTTPEVITLPDMTPPQTAVAGKQGSKADEDCCIIGSSEATVPNPVNTGESRLCSTFKQDGKEFYQCHLCPFKTAQWPVMRRHLSAHDSGKMLKCHLCDFSTLVQSTFNSHVKKHENPVMKCDICGQTVPDKIALKKHMQLKHTNQLAPQATTIYPPPQVPSNTVTGQMNAVPKASTDDVIVLSNQSGSGQTYQCTFCQFTSDQIAVVRKHILTHESGAVLRCQYCSFTTFLKSSMTMHVKKHFSPDKANASPKNIPSQSQIVPFSPRTPPTFQTRMMSPRGAVTSMSSPQSGLMRSPRAVSPRMTRSPRGISTVMTRSPRNINTVMTRSPRNMNPMMTRSPRNVNPMMTRSPRNVNPVMTRSPRNMNPMMTRSPRNMNSMMTRSPRNVNPMMTRSPRNVSPRMIRSPRTASQGMMRSPRITSPGTIRSPRNASPRQNSVNQYMMQTGMRQTSPQTIRSPLRVNQRVQQFNVTQSSPQAGNMQLALVARGRSQVSPRMRGANMQSPRMVNPGMVRPRQQVPAGQQIAVRRNLQQNFQSIPRNVRPTLALPAPPGSSTIVIDDEQMEASNSMAKGAPMEVDVVQSPTGQLWKCKLCTFNTASKKEIASHVASHNLTPQYKCPHCNHTSLSKSAMETHIKRHSLTPLPCDVCGALLSDKYTLQRHKQNHIDDTANSVVAEPPEVTQVRNQVTEVRTQVTEVRTQVKQEYVQTQVKREPQNLKQEPQ